jgi:hypothetical protein
MINEPFHLSARRLGMSDDLRGAMPDELVFDSASGSCMRLFFICMSGHADWLCMTVQQSKTWKDKSGDLLWPKGYVCLCGTPYKTKCGVVVEIVAPGIDSILFYQAPVPDDHIHDMLAMMHEKQLNPVSAPALYEAVPVCKPGITSLIIEEKDFLGQIVPNQ